MKASTVVADCLRQKPTDASRRWHPAIETQILAKSPGYPIRIDESNPNPDLSYDPSLITRIGATGRNFVDDMGEWIGIDIDATDHAKGHEDEKIAEIADKVAKLPYVDVFRSTGGRGLHLHVPLRVPVSSRAQHSRLGQYVIGQISADTGFDLSRFVDVSGGNLWIWA